MSHTFQFRSLLRPVLCFGLSVSGAVFLLQVPRAWDAALQAAVAEAAAQDPVREALKTLLVVVDPGHGGQDGGTAGNGVQEKHATLDLARRVESQLRQRGIRVRMTREADTYVELDERSGLAGRLGAAALVSIHLNASTATEVAGVETYFSSRRGAPEGSWLRRNVALSGSGDAGDRRGELLAEMIQRRVCEATGAEDREVRDSRLYVVMRAACPAVLVECGYLTNAEEARRLKKDSYKDQLAAAVADAVHDYLLATLINPRRGLMPSGGDRMLSATRD